MHVHMNVQVESPAAAGPLRRVADLADEDSYRARDHDAEHNRIRARLAPIAEQVARAQFQVPLSREGGPAYRAPS
jgi:hypothetical protein